MMKIDRAILESDKLICRQIKRLEYETRGEVSQEMLKSIRDLVEHIILKVFANGEDIEDTQSNIQMAVKDAKSNSKLVEISRFHRFIQVSVSHKTLNEENAERLILKFIEYLAYLKDFADKEFSMKILSNIEDFPLDVDEEIKEYYLQIVDKIEKNNTKEKEKVESLRYYIKKIKPFFVKNNIFYEITFIPANDYAGKTDNIIAFTKMKISDFYSVKFKIINDYIKISDKNMLVRIITNWEVDIRPCELDNFKRIVLDSSEKCTDKERHIFNKYLTQTKFNLLDIVLFPDAKFFELEKRFSSETKAHFFECLKKSRRIILNNSGGSNVLRYLLYCMRNKVIKKQYRSFIRNKETGECFPFTNSTLSYLRLDCKCIPFDTMPLCTGLKEHVPSLYDLLSCIDSDQREHELLARMVQVNTEENNVLFTPLEKDKEGNYFFRDFYNIEQLISIYNSKLYSSEKQQARKMIIMFDHVFIKQYVIDTMDIIKFLKGFTKQGIANYTNYVNYWMDNNNIEINEEKQKILQNMFSETKVSLIYGAAGTGKTYLIRILSDMFSNNTKLFLAQTNPAVNNLQRNVKNLKTNKYLTITKFLSDKNQNIDFDVVIIDECSTVSNHDMKELLEKVKFKILILVGDTYQIESISFGNWFSLLKFFLPKIAINELKNPFRTDSKILLEIWNDIREMRGMAYELFEANGISSKLDKTIFSPASNDEIVLCLNYDGLYGINNINYFLQENNNNKEIWRGVQRYKVGDPILFNEVSDNFFTKINGQIPLIYNNMKGRIVGFQYLNKDTINESIQFDIEIESPLIEMNVQNMNFEIVGNTLKGNSIIRFKVDKTALDDDGESSVNIVPFQIAYAVSIHKAQGLEYDSVKLVISNEVEELITHSIFYTAITRARKDLRIYWTQPIEKKVLSQIKPNFNKEDASLLKEFMKL